MSKGFKIQIAIGTMKLDARSPLIINRVTTQFDHFEKEIIRVVLKSLSKSINRIKQLIHFIKS